MRQFLGIFLVFWVPSCLMAMEPSYKDRVAGMVYGSAIGDAIGGPSEFLSPNRSVWTKTPRKLTQKGLFQLRERLQLDSYEKLASAYGPWRDFAPAGTITDDTRFKFFLMNCWSHVSNIESLKECHLKQFIELSKSSYPPYWSVWLRGLSGAARWILDPNSNKSFPPERLWSGVPTVAGQLALLPLAALSEKKPNNLYRYVYEMAWMDNGYAKDFTASIVVGLQQALNGASWSTIFQTMRNIDPYDFENSAMINRHFTYWMNFSEKAVMRSSGSLQKLFSIVEAEGGARTWWEPHVPLILLVASLRMAEFDGLAAMQIVKEFGQDTDTYLQLLGAFVGAHYGRSIFPQEMIDLVRNRMLTDYDIDLETWVESLTDR